MKLYVLDARSIINEIVKQRHFSTAVCLFAVATTIQACVQAKHLLYLKDEIEKLKEEVSKDNA